MQNMNKFKIYSELLLKYNSVHKLSGSKNIKEVEENIKDALYPKNFLDFKSYKNILDIGTGAGFPGMVLAIEYPDVHFTLVEPLMKRTAFLHLVKSTYGLQNVDILSDRIENIEPFKVDMITSRAVAKTDFLLDLAQSFIGVDTEILFYKGENVYDEISDNMNYKIIKRDKRNYLWIKGFK
jgi:16S rRNA (guanine527-N7)-methyltransferase